MSDINVTIQEATPIVVTLERTAGSRFKGLVDVPNSYIGQGDKFVVVKATEDGLEFATVDAGLGDMVKAIYDVDNNGIVDKAESAVIKVVVNEDIPQYVAATVTGYIADSSNIAHRGKVGGITLTAISNGTSGYILTENAITNIEWTWVTGDIIYLNGTSLSSTPPNTGFVQVMGTALNSQTINIGLRDPILL